MRLTKQECEVAREAARHCIQRRNWRGAGHGHRHDARSADDVVSEATDDLGRQLVILRAALLIANERDGVRLWDRKRTA